MRLFRKREKKHIQGRVHYPTAIKEITFRYKREEEQTNFIEIMSGIRVTLEYAQAFLLLIYYWLKTLARTLFVGKLNKDVSKEIILITGAGEFNGGNKNNEILR